MRRLLILSIFFSTIALAGAKPEVSTSLFHVGGEGFVTTGNSGTIWVGTGYALGFETRVSEEGVTLGIDGAYVKGIDFGDVLFAPFAAMFGASFKVSQFTLIPVVATLKIRDYYSWAHPYFAVSVGGAFSEVLAQSPTEGSQSSQPTYLLAFARLGFDLAIFVPVGLRLELLRAGIFADQFMGGSSASLTVAF